MSPGCPKKQTHLLEPKDLTNQENPRFPWGSVLQIKCLSKCQTASETQFHNTSDEVI